MTPNTVPDSQIGAFVLVPFSDPTQARAWVAELNEQRDPADPPIIVTEGSEDAWVDPRTGEPGYEVTFAGGWRAKVAGGGQVTIGIGDRRVAQRSAAA